MRITARRVPALVTAAALAATALLTAAPGATAAPVIDDGTELYVPQVQHYQPALRQIAQLRSAGDRATADAVQEMISTPQAVWLTGGTPAEVEREARQVASRAAGKGQVPVFVAYNIPFRDCAQYSAGGATNAAEYRSWIAGIARGIAEREAVVLLEPDGLGIIPWHTTMDGTQEWCRPAEADARTAAADRFAMLEAAVDTLEQGRRTAVYLDGTHSAWLSVGEAASRLHRAGVERAEGFFLNVSNYQRTERQVKYGEWVSKCLAYGTDTSQGGWRVGHFDYCASQYYPADPGDFSTWHLTDAWYDANLSGRPDPEQMAHFVVDTSRNGQGPWTPPAGLYPDPQDWCNPPERGLGLRPTTHTGSELADAFVWVKLPGESDGQCDRGLTDRGGVDPEWGRVDPAAGAWFPEQAVDLIRHAQPAW